ncbi:uncharacterized protein L201_003510 [Kwoniella dendrophila CBS 6074]|uniref:BHLH domain-containing protein n=1 Tax=Kwoniella dendrophila CBS 6074 TaxID=1295534 RepID=A0AAX4JT39_9TREE
MSTCVMSHNTPFSTTQDRNTEYQDTSFNTTLSDDLFDSSFSFLNQDPNNMDYYIATPDGQRSPEPTNSHINSHNNQEAQAQDHIDTIVVDDATNNHIDNQYLSLSPLTMSDPHTIFSQPTSAVEVVPSPYPYPPYAMTYDHTAATISTHESQPVQHPTHFHPYRSSTTGDFARNPRSPPRSPALSSSPHGSSFSQRLSFGVPTSVSPSLVSPQSIIGSQLSDASPNNPYMYQLPLTYGTPLNSVSNLANISPTGPGLSMVAGFPVPISTHSYQQQISPPIKGRPITRGRQAKTATKKNVKKEDDDLSDDDDEDTTAAGSGLGLSAVADNNENRGAPVSSKKEDVRKARIESEQRRRDELREGFKRLKEALPPSNQRSSKVSLLDRSVAHIQSIDSANRYLLAELERANNECNKLRDILHNDIVLRQRTASNSPNSGSQASRPQ